jgi:hypothetical protein
MLSLLTLAFASALLPATSMPMSAVAATRSNEVQTPQAVSDPVRKLAWQLHQNQSGATDLLERWASANQAQRVQLLQASARGLRGQPGLLALLFAHLSNVQVVATDTGFIAAPDAGVLELLAAVPTPGNEKIFGGEIPPFASRQPLVGLLTWLLTDPEWQTPAATTLLSWDELPISAEDPLMPFLKRALQEQWLPSDTKLAAALQLGPEVRELLLPLLVSQPWMRAPKADFKSIDTSDWLNREIVLLQLAQMNAGNHSALLLRDSWTAYVRNDLAPGVMQLLEQNLRGHLYRISAQDLAAGMASATPAQLERTSAYLLQIRPAAAADFFLATSLDVKQDASLRQRCAQAVFLCGNDRHVQALLPLLIPESPQTLILAILVGLRNRPDPGAASYLVELMPKLRTREAGVAVEVLTLASDHETRMQWLNKLGPLPPSSSHRIAQAAYAVDPSPEIVALYWNFAQEAESASISLAIAGLRDAVSEQELAQGFRELFAAANSPEESDLYLDALLNLRSDAALSVLVDWLRSPLGRTHPRGVQIAALVIEEAAAVPMFQAWWQDQAGLSPLQLDWAACALAAENPAARQRLHQRFEQIEDRVKPMFLSRMQDQAVQADLDLWLSIFHDSSADPTLRRISAHLIFRAQKQFPRVIDGLLAELERMAQTAGAAAPDDAWLVLVRGLAGVFGLEQRQDLLRRITSFEADWKSNLLLACYRGFGGAPLPEQIPALQSTALKFLQDSQARVFPADSRPDREAVGAAQADLDRVLFALAQQAPTVEQDRNFADRLLQLGLDAHPDGLGLLAIALENWSLTQAAAEEILAATEAQSSFRFPPTALDDPTLPSLQLWTDSSKLFDEIRRRYDLGELDGLNDAAVAASYRWPRDRRAHLWVGWISLSSGNSAQAQGAFLLALECSGWLPYSRLEPELGLLATQAMTDRNFGRLQDFLVDTDQADDLLRGRTVHGLLPELADLVSRAEK